MNIETRGRPIRPVILAGGAGTRLWPLSTVERPKHLLPLLGEETLFAQTLARFGTDFAEPIIVANRAQEAELRAAAPGARLLLEPMKRDSAAAIALAAELADGDELLLVCPSDHFIAEVAAFHRAIDLARPSAEAGNIVTFGIEPDHPATGFGYVAAAGGGEGVRPVARFVEKPPLAKAEAMLAQGGHYWNAGIFLGLARTWRDELERYAPAIRAAAQGALANASVEGTAIRVDEECFAASPSKSIDYAVMEHSDRVAVVPVSMGWSDIGSWQSLVNSAQKDEQGNALASNTLAIDCRNLLIRSSGPRVAAIGVEGLVIVATADAVLVMRPEEAQRVREAAEWFDRENDR